MTGPAIEALGEDALLLRLGAGIDPACNARVHALADAIRAANPPWLREVVPAYASLAVFVDQAASGDPGDAMHAAEAWLRRHGAHAATPASGLEAPPAEIQVHFGGEDGPDLDVVASATGLSAEAVVARFCAPVYQVAMLGFAPGFPYLLGLDPSLAMPRLDTPRAQVPAGSVGIGGTQAGIYPGAGPGGWRLLGRTSRRLFDPAREPPAWLTPGQQLRFVAGR